MAGSGYRWSRQTLEELVETYEREIHPEFRRSDGAQDRAYPTAAWLRERGYSGLRYALREHHDRTLATFLREDVGLADDDGDGVDAGLDIRDERTAAAVGYYFDRREDRELLAASTLASKRSRFRRWVRTYRDVHGTDALVPAAADPADEPAERQRARRVLDRIAPELATDRSRLTYVSDVRSVYSWLEEEGYVAFNPLANAEKEYEWEAARPDNPALSADDVRRLHDAAADAGEGLLVVGLAGWGLRPSELAALHVEQLTLDGDDPHVAFGDERKNGPGTVAMLYGREAVADRVASLAAEDDWSGYLFPSTASETGHVHADTVRARFRRLAERAGVSVDGAPPTPKMGRRFWYATFTDAMEDVMAEVSTIAEEQGSSSAAVVWADYLSEAARRKRRRRAMRDRLAVAFDGAAATGEGEGVGGGDD